jgi:non-homologous end joining protein Ku
MLAMLRERWKAASAFQLFAVALYPPTFESEEAFFNQRSRTNGHRIKHAKVDADTRREVVLGRSEDTSRAFGCVTECKGKDGPCCAASSASRS